jgi:hypothetical protein
MRLKEKRIDEKTQEQKEKNSLDCIERENEKHKI